MTIDDVLHRAIKREVMDDPKFIQGYRDGRHGRAQGDASEAYRIGYREGEATTAVRGGVRPKED